jgi:hypothetical protein
MSGDLLAPGEHPDLPELVCELYEAQPAVTAGRKSIPGHPAYARYLLSPLRVIATASPARVRRHAHQLLALADALELVQMEAPIGQQSLAVSDR